MKELRKEIEKFWPRDAPEPQMFVCSAKVFTRHPRFPDAGYKLDEDLVLSTIFKDIVLSRFNTKSEMAPTEV